MTPDTRPDTPPGGRELADLLRDATVRLVRAVDALPDDRWDEPSLLPGWTRAHVVAHLALNAEAMAGVLRAAAGGGPVAMYAGDDQRDADIEALAPRGPEVLRPRLFGAVTDLADALAALPPDRLDVVAHRTPGSARTFRAGEVAALRWQEVEVHHVDLGVGYGPTDWPVPFGAALVDRLAPRARATLVADDVGRTWQAGSDSPTVTGATADLAWWLTGRGGGATLTSDGELPRIEAW